MPTVVVNSTENTVTVVNSEKRIVVSDSVARGPTGATGVQGSVGTQGASGNTGSQGATGTQGTLGDPGLVWFGPWNQNEVYGVRQVVQYNGSSYVAVALNVGVIPVGNSGQWNLVSSIGAQGTTGTQGTTGVKGDTGEFGGAIFDYVYFTNTSNTDPGTANVTFNNTDLANANTLFIDFIDGNGANSFNYLQTIDDSTSAVKGTFKIANSANTLEFAYFNINGFHGHAPNYFFVPIAHLSGVTSLNDATNVTLTFARTGDKGDTGTQGVQGTEGTQGPLGTQGAVGSHGPQGAQGALGVQGSTGSGAQGAIGPQGVNGIQGAEGIGIQGTTGANGPQGATGVGTQGPTGSAGPQGVQGASSNTDILNTKQIFETSSGITGATGVVTHDCINGHIFIHSSISANFTPNFTNATIAANNATSFTLVLNQGATAYVANAAQINGVAQTINWQGSTTAPGGNANKKDIISFSVVNNNGTWITLGQLTSFG